MLFLYNNCGLVMQPKVDSMDLASVGYQHSGLETSCAECHEKNRPAAANGQVHGGGADCVACHNQSSWFRIGNFSHSPTPSSCSNCHLSDRPVGATGALGFDHARSGQSDCVSCHAQQAGVSWAGGRYNHSPTPMECSSCHANLRPVGLVGNPPFSHAQGGSGDCFSCHKSPGVTWAGGSYNHTPAPLTCKGCHSGRQPVSLVNKMLHSSGVVVQDCASCHKNTGVAWTGARYHSSVTTQPNTCTDCHSPQRPAVLVGNPPFSHAQGGSGDCASCHKSPGVTWAGGSYNHVPAPTTCIGCHIGRRPAALVGNPPFSHAQGGSGDCVSCHKNPGVTWAGGSYNHTPRPATCKDCHNGRQPANLINRMSHSLGATVDCASCHKNPGVSWAGGIYHANIGTQPTSCATCHTANRPVGNVGNPPFNHANGGLGDCASCHKRPGVTWAGGLYSHSPVPTSCNSCHSVDRPAVTRYPGSNVNVAGHYNAKDCYACHMPQSQTVQQFLFQHSNAVNQNINFCLPCHLRDGQDEHNGDRDVVLTGDGNCFNCHRTRRSWRRN